MRRSHYFGGSEVQTLAKITLKLKDIEPIIIERHTADVVEVVKCKDCKHSKYKPIIGKLEEGEQPELLYCTMFVNGQHIYEDDYCSYGERKEK